MVSKRVNDLAFSSTIVLLLVGFASSDLATDREECADKLVGLASCLPYVGGESNNPTIDCCSGLKVVLDNSKKCICILIKDRDDPNLGFKINATLAVQLPSACHSPVNITKCVDLLHLAPNSPEAKVFEGFEKSTKTNSSTPVSSGGPGKGSSTSAQEKSDGGLGKRWLVAQVICGILSFLFISHFFFLV
ncbi:non-specific lipid transfer protein GPI-anchored 6-like [Gastrolobium bilobum]|uniref:non-specific lipid transfer protein GPI-anchored 6-like n=1 Tax=Gastrolobium bilobum TaxID=150636 RepID=UPI002AB2FADE|nr:non-specific lipid transfer protein GPI-anchored 6-like [Gastrolobium bilobum]